MMYFQLNPTGAREVGKLPLVECLVATSLGIALGITLASFSSHQPAVGFMGVTILFVSAISLALSLVQHFRFRSAWAAGKIVGVDDKYGDCWTSALRERHLSVRKHRLERHPEVVSYLSSLGADPSPDTLQEAQAHIIKILIRHPLGQ